MTTSNQDLEPTTTQTTIEAVLPQQVFNMGELIVLCNVLTLAEERAEKLAQDVKDNNERIAWLSERLIPDMMTMVGLTELTLVGGKKIKLKDKVFASTPKDRMDSVLAWLKERNFQAIAKETLTVSVEHAEQLTAQGITFRRDASIHPSTLGAFVRERLADDPDNQFPRELFGVRVVPTASVSQ